MEIDALVEETVNLAYYGARAEKQAFTSPWSVPWPLMRPSRLFSQNITRVLLNLVSNAFYGAGNQKTSSGRWLRADADHHNKESWSSCGDQDLG